MALKYIILVICIGMSWAQTIPPAISDALNNLPPELQGKVDENQINDLKNKSLEAFKKKCEQNGGPNAFENSKEAFTVFVDCLKGLIDPTKLQEEVEKAKPNGQVDEVFKKYCDKTPLFKGCFQNLTDTVKPCFKTEEQNNLKTVYNISEQMANFICFKEGDRIALFISESGPECFREKQKDIEMCLNSTFGGFHFDANKLPIENIPEIKFGEEECNKFGELQTCVVSALETCEVPSSANIVDSLFKYARKSTPCKELPEKEEGNARSHTDPTAAKAPNSADSLMKSIKLGGIALAILLFANL